MKQNPVSVDKNWETKSRKAQAVYCCYNFVFSPFPLCSVLQIVTVIEEIYRFCSFMKLQIFDVMKLTSIYVTLTI